MAKKSKSAAKRRARQPARQESESKEAKTPPVQTKAKPKETEGCAPRYCFLIAPTHQLGAIILLPSQNQTRAAWLVHERQQPQRCTRLQPPNGAAGDVTLLSILCERVCETIMWT